MPVLGTLGGATSRAHGYTLGSSGPAQTLFLYNGCQGCACEINTGKFMIRNSAYDGYVPAGSMYTLICQATLACCCCSLCTCPLNCYWNYCVPAYVLPQSYNGGSYPYAYLYCMCAPAMYCFTPKGTIPGASSHCFCVCNVNMKSQYINSDQVYMYRQCACQYQCEGCVHLRYTFGRPITWMSGTGSVWGGFCFMSGSTYFGNQGGPGVTSCTHTMMVRLCACPDAQYGSITPPVFCFNCGSVVYMTACSSVYTTVPTSYSWLPFINGHYWNGTYVSPYQVCGLNNFNYNSTGMFGGDSWSTGLGQPWTVGMLCSKSQWFYI